MELLASIFDYEFFGSALVNRDGLGLLLFRFGLNVIVTSLIIVWLYYSKSKRRDYVFTFTLISTTVFLLIFLLGSEKLQIGLALGLFAIFGIIRYRTDTVPIREMTYLFLIIGLSVINALAISVSYVELFCTNFLFVLMTWVMEKTRIVSKSACKLIKYEKIDLITPDKYDEMLADIKKRTGLNITKCEVGYIDFLKDTALVKVYYESASQEINTVDQITRAKDFNG
ncbi:MAG: DUF4956 domain-containing protein [Paludibacteraceae bacterium]|nr:DUF4956 domain-containing protein [Paludibacteraceae bacterium]MBR5972225.1 DUF4956 domain-containing protein [Paludibacteraceae bacterium]